MSSASSRHRANQLLASSKGGKGLEPIRFPLGWDSRIGGIFSWYDQQTCTKFASVQHRKDRQFPFYHEFLCVKLTNGEICQFERVGDPNARTDALTQEGSLAHDYAETHPHNYLAKLDNTSDVIKEIIFPSELDLLDMLEICYHIQEDTETRSYTLQRFNCYFFSWCILLVLAQENSPFKVAVSDDQWASIIRGLQERLLDASDLDKPTSTGCDSSVFLFCDWWYDNPVDRRKNTIAALCSSFSDVILADLNLQMRGTFWASWSTKTLRDEVIASAARLALYQEPSYKISDLLRIGENVRLNRARSSVMVAQYLPDHHITIWDSYSISDFRDQDNAPGVLSSIRPIQNNLSVGRFS
jgi:hypothetical protein